MLRHRVRRPGDFHVIVAVHVDPREDQLVVGALAAAPDSRPPVRPANISAGRLAVCRAPASRPFPAPDLTQFRASARSIKDSPGPEVAADVLHRHAA
jgi:hypothetical protein